MRIAFSIVSRSGVFVAVAALLLACPAARAQSIETFHAEPAMPAMPAMPSVAAPSLALPSEAPHAVEAPPAASYEPPSAEIAAPGPPPDEVHEEAEDCDVHETQCTRSCDPLPSQWSGYRACLRYECSEKSESCIEKIAKALESRDDSDDDDDDDDP